MARDLEKKNTTTPEQAREANLVSYWNMKFKDAMVFKAPYTKKWTQYYDAYFGDYFKNTELPEYKSNFVANYIFSIIETIRPIMLDHDPKFQAMPRQPEGRQFSNDLQEAFNYEWDREGMTPKLYRDLINLLVTGTTIYFVPWDAKEKQIKGISVNSFNIYVDPLATCFEDAEYVIYATYKNEEVLKRAFRKQADRLVGSNIRYSELVRENDKNAKITNQILVLEIHTKDYEREEVERDGYKVSDLKYPKGKILTLCPDLGIVLEEKANPYDDGKFPFIAMKDYDIPGKFWGEGEVSQLLSPQKYMNELNNAVLDNAKTTANMPWVIDKSSGIPQGGITSRPGLVIRKNPGSEVRREQAPNMPNYVINAVSTFKSDMEQISGIFDSLKGNSETGVYTAQGILALQEAGQARIRLKVKLMENSLGKFAGLWFGRMKQFWKEDRWMRTVHMDGSYDFKRFVTQTFDYDYDIKITAGSTMPVNRGAMLDLMIRLAQTQMPDGQTLVDREAVATYLPDEIKATMMQRMDGQGNKQIAQVEEQVKQFEEQVTQAMQEIKKNDESLVQTVDEVATKLQEINKKILQLQGEHDSMTEEQKKQEEISKLKDKYYNEGFADAEKQLQQESTASTATPATPETISEGQGGGMGLPDDMLNGMQGMTEEQLKLLMSQHPELIDLIK